MPKHNALTGTELHEPKGAATATDGDYFVADGAGSGDWSPLPLSIDYGAMRFYDIDQELEVGVTDTWYILSGANLLTPQTLWGTGQLGSGVTFSNASNNEYLKVTNAGDYWATITLSITGIATSTWDLSMSINGTDPTNLAIAKVTTETNDTSHVTLSGIVTLAADDYIQMAIKNSTGTADIDVRSGVIAIHRLA